MKHISIQKSELFNMMTKHIWGRKAFIMLITAILSSTTGCAYFINRGNDLLDTFDIGITVSEKPKIGIYTAYLNLATFGYSNFDGTLVGLGDRNVGAVKAREQAGGIIFWGYEQFGYEDFNVNDPESPPTWKVGLAGLAEGPPPPGKQAINCPKILHLGWIGLTFNPKFGQMLDFILGLTTLDIMGDDKAD